ncbi:TPA: phosphatase PAP2 family protein [Escherichia coli]|nr:phosphatase PAP2 family protein [Escherichia coli]
MPYLSNKRLLAEMSIALVMAIVATLTLEHSQIDLMVADWFYLGMGHWMVAKQAFLPDLLLYSGRIRRAKRMTRVLKALYRRFRWVYLSATYALCQRSGQCSWERQRP